MPAPSLERIAALAELLDHPETTYPSVHLTGTNGKTTTARMVSALACAHGLTAGTFISPHVESVTERISACGVPISHDEFAEEYTRLMPYLESVDARVGAVTYFEALTALAYLWFADKPVSVGVFEVGMGGRWDATNLVRGDVAVICPIGLDHVRELGGTVEEIAAEKAGIVKAGAVGVFREQRPAARSVIAARCEDVGATPKWEDEDFGVERRAQALGGQVLTIRGLHATYDEVFVPLFGEALARNTGAAIAACEALLGRELDPSALRHGLRAVASPGRLEVVRRHPLIVLDGAHNPDAMASVASALPEAFRWRRLHLVVAMFDDKDVENVLSIVAPLADRGYAARNSSPRAAPAERTAAALEGAGMGDVERFASVSDALAAARSDAHEDDLILVTGSFYTVADARPLVVDA